MAAEDVQAPSPEVGPMLSQEEYAVLLRRDPWREGERTAIVCHIDGLSAVLRELVEALDARADIQRRSLNACFDEDDTALVAALYEELGRAEERLETAWEAARAVVPEVAS